VLRRGLKAAPDSADLHHALGLALIRSGDRPAALSEWQQAVRLAPDNARYTFVYAVALYSMARPQDAMTFLEAALKKHPTIRDMLFTLLQYHRELGYPDRAKELATRFRKTWPNDSISQPRGSSR